MKPKLLKGGRAQLEMEVLLKIGNGLVLNAFGRTRLTDLDGEGLIVRTKQDWRRLIIDHAFHDKTCHAMSEIMVNYACQHNYNI